MCICEVISGIRGRGSGSKLFFKSVEGVDPPLQISSVKGFTGSTGFRHAGSLALARVLNGYKKSSLPGLQIAEFPMAPR
jgi:hypothetical protein